MFPLIKKPKKVIYLDYAATTPVDPRVQKVMRPFENEVFGNPSSLYRQGREAAESINASRGDIANILGVSRNEIIFTAGGTESINLAIFGAVRGCLQNYKNNLKKIHLITSAIEHPAVLESVRELQRQGAQLTVVDVDSEGFIQLDKLFESIRPETVLISVMHANNEIGTIQPIAEIGKRLAKINSTRFQEGLPKILFHTDACQTAGVLDVRPGLLGVDLLSANGSKMYGPKQTGFLYVRAGVVVSPLIFGGGQEYNKRSGTENVAGIVGLAKAFVLANKEQKKENKRQETLRDYCIQKLNKKIPGIILNGPRSNAAVSLKNQNAASMRLPNNIHFSIPGVDGEALLLYLDSYCVAVSTGSACSSASNDPSHVLLAIGRTTKEARGSLRITLGKFTKKSDLEYLIKLLPELVAELQKVVS